jgi:hypothetical protein
MRTSRRRLAAAVVAVAATAALAGCLPVTPPPPPPGTFTGLGFDTCSAPSAGVMSAWLNSPYRAVGVYIGGETRACSQPNQTASWVSTVAATGWRLMPLYVGLQAPCNAGLFGSQVISYDPNGAGYQGTVDADAAIGRANQIGLGPGTPIYFDMEAYDNSNVFCSAAVIYFLNGWDAELQARGYPAGVYSSSGSGMVDLVHQVGNPYFHGPNDIWFAHWNFQPTVWNDSFIPNGYWNFHARIHQYSGGHGENYGGIWLDIDQDAVDTVLPA